MAASNRTTSTTICILQLAAAAEKYYPMTVTLMTLKGAG
jgi:hypothetical protein